MIPKKDLIDGAYYYGHCRNAYIARWNAKEECFYHWRTKFGSTFIETIKHPEDEKVWDVFEPEAIIEKDYIPFEKNHGTQS